MKEESGVFIVRWNKKYNKIVPSKWNIYNIQEMCKIFNINILAKCKLIIIYISKNIIYNYILISYLHFYGVRYK